MSSTWITATRSPAAKPSRSTQLRTAAARPCCAARELGWHDLGVEQPQSLVVPAQAEGARLDVFLAQQLGLGRRYVWRLLARDAVTLGGRPAAKGTVLRAGERVEIAAFRHPSQGPVADPGLRLRVLAEIEGLLAVDKPAGIPSHPLEFDEPGTALGAVLALRPAVREAGAGGLECGLVHRLDTLTSGVLLFATERRAWQEARAAFAQRRVRKRYLARVHGELRSELELSLLLAPRGKRVRVVARGGRESLTRVSPLEVGERTSLIAVEPVTGLRHQIRAVLAHLGHPVAGDALYGSPLGLARHLLHAERIELGPLVAHAPVPSDFDPAP
jgi:23S rRNA pseudouridine1911/1915/1917 synthase